MSKVKKCFVLLMLLAICAVLIFSATIVNANDEVITINDFAKVDASLSEYNFTFNGEDNRYVVIKQATKVIIWTEKVVAVEEQAEFMEDFKAVCTDKSLNLDDVTFVYGAGEHDLTYLGTQFGTYTFEVKDNGTVVLSCNADKISHADYGTYVNKHDKVEEEPEEEFTYEWIPVGTVGEDSATGFGREGTLNYRSFKKGNNWFQAQKVDFSNTDSITLDIQAGNFKNKTNFVGEVTLTKNGNEYTIEYTEDKLPDVEGYEEGDTYVLNVLSGSKYLSSKSSIAVSNNGKDLNAYVSGDTFTMEENVFNFYTHFNVEYVEYVLTAVPVTTAE